MWARIDSGLVAEITDMNPDGRFHPSLEWVSCGSGVELGMTYVMGRFGAKPARPLTELAAEARYERDRQLRDIYDVGALIAARSLRLTSDPAEIELLQARQSELDAYAVALLNVPQQENFPTEIEWPTIP